MRALERYLSRPKHHVHCEACPCGLYNLSPKPIREKYWATLKSVTLQYSACSICLSRISFEKYFSSFIIGKDPTSLLKQENYQKSLQDL